MNIQVWLKTTITPDARELVVDMGERGLPPSWISLTVGLPVPIVYRTLLEDGLTPQDTYFIGKVNSFEGEAACALFRGGYSLGKVARLLKMDTATLNRMLWLADLDRLRKEEDRQRYKGITTYKVIGD